jgi:hypothetical protein
MSWFVEPHIIIAKLLTIMMPEYDDTRIKPLCIFFHKSFVSHKQRKQYVRLLIKFYYTAYALEFTVHGKGNDMAGYRCQCWAKSLPYTNPMSLQWQLEIKANLGMSLRTSCLHMVVCAKKNGTPKTPRTWTPMPWKYETHHTHSPFCQVSSIPSGKKKTGLLGQISEHSLTWRRLPSHYLSGLDIRTFF